MDMFAIFNKFGILGEIGKSVWQCFIEPFHYLQHVEENMDMLRNKMEELCGREADVKLQLECAKQQSGLKPMEEVRVWLRNVQKLKDEVHDIQVRTTEVSSCSLWRLNLGKLVVKKIGRANELMESGRFSGGLLANWLPASILPATKLVGKTTAEGTLNQIFESLMKADVQRIGVYGMGGVGKTTLLIHIHNKLENMHLFHSIIWVTVSRDSSVERLQNDIAKKLCLNLHMGDETSRAGELLTAFARRRKFVLILDDMWKPFPLEKVGIPEPNEENGCKIVLTTRSLNVCRGMKCQEKVRVEVLSEEEAWQLFKEKLGADIVLSIEVEPLAKLVTKECCGLPLGIITVARAMTEKDDISEWRNALEELKCSTTDIEGMEDEVFLCLKFSYDRLKSDKIRACFLHCALYPEDYRFSAGELIQNWMTEGLIDEMGDREKELDKGQTILNGLIDACVLVRTLEDRIVMHDLIRDLAICIRRTSPRFIVKAGIGVREFPRVEELTENVDKISLMRNEIRSLSGEPNCHNISTLLLQGNPLGNISDWFFNSMSSLRVLDLSHTGISYLPISISNLVNLRALLLNNCTSLRKVVSLEKLKELRFLVLSYTAIEELPHGMECLVNLRVLDLDVTSRLQRFEAGIISKLTRLQKLSVWKSTEMGVGKIQEIVSLENLTELQVRFEEMEDFIKYVKSKQYKGLKRYHLTLGSYHYNRTPDSKRERYQTDIVGCNLIDHDTPLVFPDSVERLVMISCKFSRLPCLSVLQQLQDCHIQDCVMGCWVLTEGNTTLPSFPALQDLSLSEVFNLRGISEGVLPPGSFSSLKHLDIGRCPNMKNLMSLELLLHLQNLEVIEVNECSAMEVVIEGGMAVEGNTSNSNAYIVLPKLQRLVLKGLPKLKTLCNRVLLCHALHRIIIKRCPQLKTDLFGHDNSFVLPHDIVLLTMEDCMSGLQHLVASRGNNTFLPLPALQVLRVIQLVSLRSIGEGLMPPGSFASLRSLHIEHCPNVTNLLSFARPTVATGGNNTFLALPALQQLCVIQLVSLRSMFEGLITPGSFVSLRSLHIEHCPKVENLLPLGSLKHLQNLEEIQISNCNAMKAVIEEGEEGTFVGGDNNNNNSTILLPKLQQFHLMNLSNLRSVCNRSFICPSVRKITIHGCNQLKKLPLSIINATDTLYAEIRGSKEWWDSLELCDPTTKEVLKLFYEEDDVFQIEEDDKRRGTKRKADEEPWNIASTSRPRTSSWYGFAHCLLCYLHRLLTKYTSVQISQLSS